MIDNVLKTIKHFNFRIVLGKSSELSMKTETRLEKGIYASTFCKIGRREHLHYPTREITPWSGCG